MYLRQDENIVENNRGTKRSSYKLLYIHKNNYMRRTLTGSERITFLHIYVINTSKKTWQIRRLGLQDQ